MFPKNAAPGMAAINFEMSLPVEFFIIGSIGSDSIG